MSEIGGQGLGGVQDHSVPDYTARFQESGRPQGAALLAQGPPPDNLLQFLHTAVVAPAQSAADSELFGHLARAWKAASAPISSITEMSMLPEYQRIIGMGRRALPLILAELAQEPDHWFWALKAITGDDPVPAEHRGDIARMAAAWVQWGRDNGIIPARSIG